MSRSPDLNLWRYRCPDRPDVLGLLLRADIFVRRTDKAIDDARKER